MRRQRGCAAGVPVTAIPDPLRGGDRAIGTDALRSMARRAGATITEAEGSHVIMISQPQVVIDVIRQALATPAPASPAPFGVTG